MTGQPPDGGSEVLAALHRHEPSVLHAQMAFVWDHAEGVHVFAPGGRAVLDFTSGVVTANTGHSPSSVVEAIVNQAQSHLLHAYSFPTRPRAEAVERLADLTGFAHSVLLTTGAEVVELALKIALTRHRAAAHSEPVVVSFSGAFHGRTLGAQLSSGLTYQKHWTPALDNFCVLPFPSRRAPWPPGGLDRQLQAAGVDPGDVACVLLETVQGSTLDQIEADEVVAIGRWCRAQDALLVCDEIQTGFGRTGRLFGFEHAGLSPDLVLCGKAMTGSLPASAVLYDNPRLLEGFATGELNNTHAANPIVLAAMAANLQLYDDGRLIEAATGLGHRLADRVDALIERHGPHLVDPRGLGLIWGFDVVTDGEPARELARQVVETALQRGLLMFTPIGPDHNLLKIAPPLIITPAELDHGLDILDGALSEVLGTGVSG